jgi:glutathione S-transferase
MTPSSATPLSWSELEPWAAAEPDRVQGPTNAQAQLRLFGAPESAVRVTLYRDHHAWCPYCQKIWLWLEERRIPYRIRKVTMVCYGEKEAWYRQIVPSGMLPALEIDGHLITESDLILQALEHSFGSLGPAMASADVQPLRLLERQLFRAWCQWLCIPNLGERQEQQARSAFDHLAATMAELLERSAGPFFLGEFSTADLVFVPYVERMNASLAYYKGYLLRREHPALHRWFGALEQRSTYLGTQSDFHTHAHDLPPQMGGCYSTETPEQRDLARRIDHGLWPIVAAGEPDPETSAVEPLDAAAVALARMLRHRTTLVQRPPLRGSGGDQALRCALTGLIGQGEYAPPAGTAGGLRYLRDRISVPRDMPLHAARHLRQALERTAALDPTTPAAQGDPLPNTHRRDQNPRPFLLGTPLGSI